jgi:hypothetical protein
MAIRLTAYVRSIQDRIYKIEIHDKELPTDSPYEFDTLAPGPVITWEGDNNDFYKRIIPGKAQFNMLLTSPEYTINQGVAISEFYNDMSISREGRFFLRIIEGSLEVEETIFIGKILADVGDLQLSPLRELTITAVDGMADLKDLEFRPMEDTLLGQALPKSFAYHIIDILQRNDVVDYFYGPEDTILQTYSRWKEIGQPSGTDPFQEVLVRNMWFRQVNQFFKRYENCSKVLTDILSGFNARIYFSRGYWRVEQISAKQSLTPPMLAYYKNSFSNFYAATGTGPSSTSVSNYDSDDNLHMSAYPATALLPPFKSVELIQPAVFYNYLKQEYELASIYNSDPALDVELYGPYDLGEVLAGSYRFVFDWKIITTSVLGELVDQAKLAAPAIVDPFQVFLLFIEFEVMFRVGSWYAASESIWVSGAANESAISGDMIPYVEAEWSNTSTDRIKFRYLLYDNETGLADEQTWWHLGSRLSRQVNLLISTEEVPEDGDIEIEITNVKISRTSTESFPNRQATPVEISIDREYLDWRISSQSRIILANQVNDVFEQPDRISLFEINDLRNKINYKIEFPFSDSPGDDLDFRLMRFQDGVFVSTESWIDPTAGTDSIQRLSMKEVLALRAAPVRVYKSVLEHRTAIRTMHFSSRVVIRGNLFIPMRMVSVLMTGEVTSVLFQIASNFAVIEDKSPKIGDPNVPDFPTSTQIGNGEMSPPVGMIYTEFWAFENVSDDNVVLEDFSILSFLSDDETLNRKRWQVFVNGVKQRPNYGGTLTQGQYDFDAPFDKIIFFRALNNAYVEVYYFNYLD